MSELLHTSAGQSLANLRQLIKHDYERSKELEGRIEQLRQLIKEGKMLPVKKVDLMEMSNKDMVKDLLVRIDQIESTKVTATDREMLQALNARLTVCDVQAMQLAELRELEREARGDKADFLEPGMQSAMHDPIPAHSVAVTGERIYRGEQLASKSGDLHGAPNATATEFEGHNSDDSTDYAISEHYRDDDDDEDSMTTWPTPYRALRIHPYTQNDVMAERVKESMATLAAKHDPKRAPNDADASQRWAILEACKDVLIDAEKRRFMDSQDKLPPLLEGLDLARLNLD